MSKPTLLATIGIAALAISPALIASCGKKTENKEAPGAASGAPAAASDSGGGTPGVTATEIRIGQSIPYSGPASAYAMLGKGEAAYFQMINDKGGINGRKIKFISLDDGYSPPKAVENVRKLVESENVALIFNNVGTAHNAAVQKYLNDKKVPQLFVASGADRWADPAHFPWTIGFQPSYRGEAKIYAHYLMKEKPGAKLCVLYQNDDFGKEYLSGLKEVLGDQYDKTVVKAQSYEVTDPTVDSQVVTLQGAGCDALLTAATPKFAAQTIRKVADLGWKPLHMMSNVSISRTAVLAPAGLDKSTGIVSAGYLKDINDPALANDPGLNEYRAFAKQYLTGLDLTDGTLCYAYGVAQTLAQVLTQAGNDLSRENIMKQAASLKNLQLGVVGTGIVINTGPTDFRPYEQFQFARFNGNNFDPFGDILSAE
ncbi:MAG TPA: ABC transporter substrate-binding protein [Kofleriaceae bacterium]|jgi:ABC-type branched-subunit amino acid transport system substrate-binding protein|nr:ABC transporter substrate-binding protein [Kofleriaceae bacterium]